MSDTYLFTPSVLSINDEQNDITEFIKKYELTDIEKNIENHFVRMEFKDFTSSLLNAVSYSLSEMIECKRIVDIELITDEAIILENHVKRKLNLLILSSAVAEGKIELNKTNDHVDGSPMYVTSHDFKHKNIGSIKKYVDFVPLITISISKNIILRASIVKNTCAKSHNTCYEFINNFNREEITIFNQDRIPFGETDNFEIEYNSGVVTFSYQDNVDGKEIYNQAIENLIYYFTELKNNLEKYIIDSVATTIIRLIDDRSGVLTNLLFIYIYNSSDKKTHIKDVANNITYSLEIWDNKQKSIIMVNKGIDLILQHLNGLN